MNQAEKKVDCDFLILGSSGMQGAIVARDLLERGYKILLSDIHKNGLEKVLKKFPETKFERLDLRKHEDLLNLMRNITAPVVINCAEGNWNIDVYKICLQTKKHVIDLGSSIPMTEEQLALNEEFKKEGLTAITGCGSTPGINNIMLRYAADLFKSIDTVEAGFAWNSNIRKFVVPFSIESIVEELTESAPTIKHNKWVNKKPLKNAETRKFKAIGKQECFFVRHPETYTFLKYFKDKGVKNIRFYAGFPDHSLNVLLTIVNLGLHKEGSIELEGIDIRPIDALSQLLRKVRRPIGYKEKENLWVNIFGRDSNNKKMAIKMECIVPTLPEWEDAGCNIDTGIPTSIIARMIKNGKIDERGSFAPEANIIPAIEFFKELQEMGMTIYKNGRAIKL